MIAFKHLPLDAFDKFTGEILSEIDERALIQQEKPLEQKGGGVRHKK